MKDILRNLSLKAYSGEILIHRYSLNDPKADATIAILAFPGLLVIS